jgi:branched-chain amino acid transport system permease protein
MPQTHNEPSFETLVGRICRPPFLGMCVLTMAVLLPLIANDYWLKGVLIPALVFSLATLGLNLVTGFAGLISVGQSAFMAIGAFIAVITYARYDLPLLICMILGGSAASAVGAIVGLPALRIRGFYLMTATLAAQFIVTWTIQHVPWFGARSFGTINTPPVSIGAWHIGTATNQYYLTLLIVAPLTIFAWNLVNSRIGRAWIAIRERETAAAVLGISTGQHKILAFAAAAFYGGVSGSLLVFAWVGAANIQEFSLDLSIQILGMVIIGGLGSISGSFLGAFFVALLPIALSTGLHWFGRAIDASSVSSQVIANTEHIVFGSLLLIFLSLEPRGLARLASRLALSALTAAQSVRRVGNDGVSKPEEKVS